MIRINFTNTIFDIFKYFVEIKTFPLLEETFCLETFTFLNILIRLSPLLKKRKMACQIIQKSLLRYS